MKKFKLKRILAISMAFSMIFSTNAFATPINLANSEMDVKTDTLDKSTGTDYFIDEENEWLDGTINEEVRVTVDLASQFTITIPKDIVLDGETGKADYKVKAVGDIAGDQKLSVVPDPDFVLSEAGGKADVTATVTQPDTEYVYTDLQGDGTEYDGSIAATLTAGEWAGRFNFNINFEGGSSSSLPEVKATLNDYTWEEIDVISKSGQAETTYGLKVGDTKEMTLTNGETYNAEIIGFNHDYLPDENGGLTKDDEGNILNETAGITLQFKELMNTKHVMNSNNSNAGGWESSTMRTYLREDVYNLLPEELKQKDVIKEVIKISDAGNKDKTTLIETVDKLFLLSFEEVGFTSSDDSYFVSGQGTKYEIYDDNASRVKYFKDTAIRWWFRSSYTDNTISFFSTYPDGRVNTNASGASHGVAPAFCI